MTETEYLTEAREIARIDYRDVAKFDAMTEAMENADTLAAEWTPAWCQALVSGYYERING